MNNYYLLFIACIVFGQPAFGMNIKLLLNFDENTGAGRLSCDDNGQKKKMHGRKNEETEGMGKAEDCAHNKKQKITAPDDLASTAGSDALKKAVATYLKHLFPNQKPVEESEAQKQYTAIMDAFARISQLNFGTEHTWQQQGSDAPKSGNYLSTFTIAPSGTALKWNGIEIIQPEKSKGNLILTTDTLLNLFYPAQEARKKLYYIHSCPETKQRSDNTHRPIKTFNRFEAIKALIRHKDRYHQAGACPHPLENATHSLTLAVQCTACKNIFYFTNRINFSRLTTGHLVKCPKKTPDATVSFTVEAYETKAPEGLIREYNSKNQQIK